MNSKLVLLSRYMFVTTENQAKELLSLVEDASGAPGALDGLLVILDSNLVLGRRTSSKLKTALSYLFTQSRKLDLTLLIVKNEESHLDKRVELQLTHISRIVSREIKRKEARL